MHRVVTVWTRWGDYVLGVHDVRPGESLSVGSPPQPLVRFRRGTVSVCAPGETERDLQVGESVTVELGALEYTLCCEEPERAATFAPSGRAWALLDAAVLGVLFVALAWRAAPVVVLSDAGVPVPIGALASPEPAREQPVHEPIFAVSAAPEAELLRLPGDMRCGRTEMGAYIAETRGRYGLAGPKDNADPHVARPVPGHGYPTAHGNLAELMAPQTQPGSSGPTAPFGRDAGLGTDASSAQGDMWGEQLADARGENGFGVAGYPGGVAKSFEVAPLSGNPTAQLRVLHTGLRVTGARKVSEVGRVMAARFADFRACTTSVEPQALHSVQLEFDVNEAGRAAATGSSVEPLEQCLEATVAGAAFAPGASEPAHVVYPLHFVAADAGLKNAPVARPPSQHGCDCG